jgi:hypothetical protein
MISRGRSQVSVMFVAVAVGAVLLGGCMNRKLKPLNPCLVSGVVAEIAVTNIDKVDMLFMVDNSNSMKEEQQRLRSQFGHLVKVLTSGDRGDGSPPFPAVRDLHLGVVSSDMGLSGIDEVKDCDDRGDDGILLHAPTTDPNVTGCEASYPTFLLFSVDDAAHNNPDKIAADFQCISTLGTTGCGFEQQLEAPLKALWPANDPHPFNGMNRITFVPDRTGQGFLGHGDDADNGGFLRNDPARGLSLIAVILVTDEEDCSSSNNLHFTPKKFLDANSALYTQPLNLRCYYAGMETDPAKSELYPVSRYVLGFQELRPDNKNLVIFGAIAGVPPKLVDKEHLDKVDFTDDTAREAFYTQLLADPAMQEVPDPSTMTTPENGNLMPSCITSDSMGNQTTKAYPPRRIVEVARGFGANGLVQSICQDDFGPALDAIIAVIARQLGSVCLPRELVRKSDGKVGCEVVWELPPATADTPAGTPTACGNGGGEWNFLLTPGADRKEKTTKKGGSICIVAQLAVKEGATVPTETNGQMFEQGWYYDDFSPEREQQCLGGTSKTKQRIAFAGSNGKPPTGVTVKLECLNETQSLANSRTDISTAYDQPEVGDACDMAMVNGHTVPRDQACNVALSKPSKKWPDGIDKSMICHKELNVCVLTCNTSSDCPPAWVCDGRDGTKMDSGGPAICVNPTCGELK